MRSPTFLPRARVIRFIAYIAVSLIIVIVSLSVIGTTAQKNAEGKANYSVSSPAVFDENLEDYLDVTAVVSSVDVPNQVMKVNYFFSLGGDLLSEAKGTFPETKYDINFSSTTQKFFFAKGSALLPQTGTIFIDGDFNQYPFDSFDGYFLLQGTFGSDKKLLPIRLTLAGVPNGFKIEYTATDADSDIPHTEVYGIASISRSDSVKTFAMLITITMWALGTAAAIYTMSLYLFDKRPEPPTVGFHVALLFAMPSVRNSMPVAPPIGSLIDQMCLVWVMMLLAICVLLQFVKFVLHFVLGEKAAAMAELKKKESAPPALAPAPARGSDSSQATDVSIPFLAAKV